MTESKPRNNKKEFKKRNCEHCKELRPKIAETHYTAFCRFKPDPQNGEANNAEEQKNKEAKGYFYDTAATKSFTHTDIKNSTPVFGKHIIVANGEQAPITSRGTLKIGKIPIDFYISKDLKRNLVSGIALMKDGYDSLLEANGDLTIKRENTVMATGKYDPESDLIKMDCIEVKDIECNQTETSSKSESWQELHTRFGHMSKKAMKRSLPIMNRFDTLKEEGDCQDCELTKRRKANVPKVAKTILENPLQILEMDIQGPFKIKCIKGSSSNVKVYDKFTGYIKQEQLNSKESKATKEFIERFVNRTERQSGFKVKRIRTDGGNEFNGEFLSYVESKGIIKEKTERYKHHLPGGVEKANDTIASMALPNLRSSNLPKEYYSLAQQYSVYIYNRTIKENQTASPFELLYGKKPRMDRIFPFGCIGSAYIAPELRMKSIGNRREKVRLVGFGDDDDTEETSGWLAMVEETGEFIYSNDIIWHTEWPRHPIKDIKENYEDTFVLDDFDEDYSSSSQSFVTNTDASTLGNESTLPDSPAYQPIDEEMDSEDERQEMILQDINARYADLFQANNAECYDNPSTDRLMALLVSTQQIDSNPEIPKSFKEAVKSKYAPQWMLSWIRSNRIEHGRKSKDQKTGK